MGLCCTHVCNWLSCGCHISGLKGWYPKVSLNSLIGTHTVWKYRSLVQGAHRACTMHVKASHGIKRVPGIYLIRMCVCSRVKPYGAPDLMWLREEHLNRISAKHRAEPMIWCDWGISTLSTSFHPWLISRNVYRRSSVPLKFRTRDIGVASVTGTQALEINHFPNFINASNISFRNNYFHWCKTYTINMCVYWKSTFLSWYLSFKCTDVWMQPCHGFRC